MLAAASVSAGVMKGPGSWSNPVSAGQVTSISIFLNSPAASAVGFPGLVAGLRGSLNTEAVAPALAPVADALVALGVVPGAVPTAMQFEKALIEASRAVYSGASVLVKEKTPAEAAAWEGRAKGLRSYTANYALYMAPHEVAGLREEADAADVTAAVYRGEAALALAQRNADALGHGRVPQEVPAGQSEPGAGLSHSTERNASAQEPTPPAPEIPAPAPKKDALVTAAVKVGSGIVMTAMALFLATTWATIGTGAALAASLAYLIAFWGGASVLQKKGFAVASGVLATLAVVMAPVSVAAGLAFAGATWDTFAVRLAVEFAAVGAAVIAAKRFRFGFLAMPAAVALLGMAADIVGLPHAYAYGPSALFSAFGALLIVGGRRLDVSFKDVDYARWVYLAGLTALVFGAGMLAWNYLVLPKLVFALGGTALIALGAIIDRKSFAVYGAGALFSYIGYLLWDVFGGTLFSYFGMAGFGVGVIALAVFYQKNAAAIGAYLRGLFSGQHP